MNVNITLQEALIGFHKKIQFIDGTDLIIKSNKVIQPDSVKIYKNKGFLEGGNLYIRFIVMLENKESNTNFENNIEDCDANFSETVKRSLGGKL